MNDQHMEHKKRRATKTLAVIGLLSVLVLLAWTSVQIVQTAPSTFSALVAITDRVHGPATTTEYELLTTVSDDIINTGEDTIVSWNELNLTGTYIFSYPCQNGVGFSTQLDDADRLLACGTEHDLGDIRSLTLTGTSEQRRFTDVEFTLTFQPDTESVTPVVATDMLTIVNNRISPVVERTDETIPESDSAEPLELPDTPTETPVVTTPDTTLSQESVPNTTVTRPTGLVDLVSRLNDIGTLVNGRFIPTTDISRGESGALQFTVTNTGTVTSDSWQYKATLPGGVAYTSTTQSPLLPGSTALLTFGFRTPNTAGTYPIELIAIAENDIDESSNILQTSIVVE